MRDALPVCPVSGQVMPGASGRPTAPSSLQARSGVALCAALPTPPHRGKITAVYEQDSLLADCLDPTDRAVLAFARSHPRRCPDALTRSVLGLSATAYYQRLLALLDRVEAVVAEPALVDRLRAERDHRRKARCRTA
jgi:Protein of unknown function (DUF3263)